MKNLSRILAIVLAFALLAAACGDDDDAETTAGSTTDAAAADPDPEPEPEPEPDADSDGAMEETDDGAMEETDDGAMEEDGAMEDMGVYPITIETAAGPVTLDSQPQRIVSMSPSLTEVLFAIGAGDQVVAVDSFSYYPEEAPVTDLSSWEPNVEAILGFEPDLVIIDFDPGDLAANLDAAGVPTMTLWAPATVADLYVEIDQLGAATGHIGGAAELVGQMQTDINALVAQVPDRETPLSFYHELDDTLYSVTSSTFIGEIYTLAGLVNIADEADPDGSLGGYPQLSAELLVGGNPDMIFLADTKCCGQTAETVAARPGWGDLAAVQSGNVVELDDDIASRWGPRIVDFLEVIVTATADVEVPVG